MANLARALHHMHVNGFVHNDLKSDNVALIKVPSAGTTKRWIPIILDFGEATEIANKVRRKHNGHHRHIDPEVLSGSVSHSPRSDIFSIEVIIRNMCNLVQSKGLQDFF